MLVKLVDAGVRDINDKVYSIDEVRSQFNKETIPVNSYSCGYKVQISTATCIMSDECIIADVVETPEIFNISNPALIPEYDITNENIITGLRVLYMPDKVTDHWTMYKPYNRKEEIES